MVSPECRRRSRGLVSRSDHEIVQRRHANERLIIWPAVNVIPIPFDRKKVPAEDVLRPFDVGTTGEQRKERRHRGVHEGPIGRCVSGLKGNRVSRVIPPGFQDSPDLARKSACQRGCGSDRKVTRSREEREDTGVSFFAFVAASREICFRCSTCTCNLLCSQRISGFKDSSGPKEPAGTRRNDMRKLTGAGSFASPFPPDFLNR